MKYKLTILALAAALMSFAACDSNTSAQQGKPFEELPELQASDILSFFKALPEQDLPDRIQSPEVREKYYKKFREMAAHGSLADGEGPEETANKTDNSVFWSDYLDILDTEEVGDIGNGPHPYLNLYVYAGGDEGKLLGVLRSGAFYDDGEKNNPDKCYWYDTASGKLSETKIPVNPQYTADDLTADVLLTYGAENLYYAVKNKKFINNFHDRGFDVIIDEAGPSGVRYEWNGVSFCRNKKAKVLSIYNYAFANFMIGGQVPYNVPGYSTKLVSGDTPFDLVYYLVKDGENEPALIFHAGPDDTISMIEVCPDRYVNPYGVYPGMPVADLLKLKAKIDERFAETTYLSIGEPEDGFVTIYLGFDEDFCYKVPAGEYLGDEKFNADAKIARVVIVNAVG